MKVIGRVTTFVLPISISRVCAPHEYVFIIYSNKFLLTHSLYLNNSVSGELKLMFGAEKVELPFDSSIINRLLNFGYNFWHKLNLYEFLVTQLKILLLLVHGPNSMAKIMMNSNFYFP